MFHIMDPSHYQVDETLRDGRPVVVRAIHGKDQQEILAAYHELDSHSIYLRFFAARGEPTAAELRDWTEVDFASLVRLILCLAEPNGERIIGGASYALLVPANPAAGAEISFLIEEDFQGQGLATMLLQHLVCIARSAGITHFVAETLIENRSMVSVFARSGLPMKRWLEDGVVRIRLDLTA